MPKQFPWEIPSKKIAKFNQMYQFDKSQPNMSICRPSNLLKTFPLGGFQSLLTWLERLKAGKFINVNQRGRPIVSNNCKAVLHWKYTDDKLYDLGRNTLHFLLFMTTLCSQFWIDCLHLASHIFADIIILVFNLFWWFCVFFSFSFWNLKVFPPPEVDSGLSKVDIINQPNQLYLHQSWAIVCYMN